jgi:hypothetical protein
LSRRIANQYHLDIGLRDQLGRCVVVAANGRNLLVLLFGREQIRNGSSRIHFSFPLSNQVNNSSLVKIEEHNSFSKRKIIGFLTEFRPFWQEMKKIIKTIRILPEKLYFSGRNFVLLLKKCSFFAR